MGSRKRKPATYEPPVVVDYGDIFEITAATQNGNNTDKQFPQNTPKDLLTFSQ
jgi:hypothetical protein